MDKTRLSKQEFEELFEIIDDKDIPKDTSSKEETVLSEEEQRHDENLKAILNWNEEE